MNKSQGSPAAFCALLVLGGLAGLPARADVDFDALAQSAAKSLVIVDVTLHNENSAGEDSGQGIVLSPDGVILIAGSLIPESMPREWITGIRVRQPGRNFEAVPARMLGRTRDRVFAYLKTDTPLEAVAFAPGQTAPPKLGRSVFSVSIAPKSNGYAMYIGKSDIRAVLELSHTLVSTASFGLTRGTSPVFDAQTGRFIGITAPALPESMVLRDTLGGIRRVELTDEEQTSVFLPVSEVQDAIRNVPTEPFDLRRSWLGVDNLTGLQEDVRALRKITQTSGVMIGSVIAGEAAEKGGLRQGEIVLTINGREVSTNPVPEMMVAHFRRALDATQPGEKVTLGVLREGNIVELPVTMGTYPRVAGEMKHVLSPKVGVVTRDLVFFDAYSRRLPQDTRGVVVSLVKNGSPASLGATPLAAGQVITKVEDQTVENQEQFLEILGRLEANAQQKEIVFVVILANGETKVCRVDLTK